MSSWRLCPRGHHVEHPALTPGGPALRCEARLLSRSVVGGAAGSMTATRVAPPASAPALEGVGRHEAGLASGGRTTRGGLRRPPTGAPWTRRWRLPIRAVPALVAPREPAFVERVGALAAPAPPGRWSEAGARACLKHPPEAIACKHRRRSLRCEASARPSPSPTGAEPLVPLVNRPSRASPLPTRSPARRPARRHNAHHLAAQIDPGLRPGASASASLTTLTRAAILGTGGIRNALPTSAAATSSSSSGDVLAAPTSAPSSPTTAAWRPPMNFHGAPRRPRAPREAGVIRVTAAEPRRRMLNGAPLPPGPPARPLHRHHVLSSAVADELPAEAASLRHAPAPCWRRRACQGVVDPATPNPRPARWTSARPRGYAAAGDYRAGLRRARVTPDQAGITDPDGWCWRGGWAEPASPRRHGAKRPRCSATMMSSVTAAGASCPRLHRVGRPSACSKLARPRRAVIAPRPPPGRASRRHRLRTARWLIGPGDVRLALAGALLDMAAR